MQREDIPLKSSLKNEYAITLYTITNNSPESIKLMRINWRDPDQLIHFNFQKKVYYFKSRQKRFPSVYLDIPGAFVDAKNNLVGAYEVNNGLLFFVGIFSSIYDVCVKFPVAIGQSIWFTVAAPYYFIKDKKDNICMQEDLSVLGENNKVDKLILPNGSTVFYVFVFRSKSSGFGKELFFEIKCSDANEYSFYY